LCFATVRGACKTGYMARVRLLLLLALAACSHRVPAVEPSSDVELPWCFRVLLRDKGGPHVLGACAMDVKTCEHLREFARRYGSHGGIEAVGACR
jgi:hypothetical protein